MRKLCRSAFAIVGFRHTPLSDEPKQIFLEKHPSDVTGRFLARGLLHLQHHGAYDRHYGNGTSTYAALCLWRLAVGIVCDVLCLYRICPSQAVLEGVRSDPCCAIGADVRVGSVPS